MILNTIDHDHCLLPYAANTVVVKTKTYNCCDENQNYNCCWIKRIEQNNSVDFN